MTPHSEHEVQPREPDEEESGCLEIGVKVLIGLVVMVGLLVGTCFLLIAR